MLGLTEAAAQAGFYSTDYFNYAGFTVAAVFFIILTIPLARFTDHLIKEREQRERAQARVTSDNSHFVTLENVTKRFGDLEVLHGIDLTVDLHQVVCLIGASGSGKSTLLRCVNLLEHVDEGTIVVDGQVITGAKVDVNALAAEDRHRVPGLQPLPAHDGDRERDPRADAGAQAVEGARRTQEGEELLRSSGSRTRRTSTRTAFPAASNSASRSPARWR